MEDHVFGLHLPLLDRRGGLSSDPKRNCFYSEHEIDRLHYAPPPSDPAMIPEQQARIQEITSAWEGRVAECEKAEAAAGLTAAAEAIDGIVGEQRTIAKKIAALPATTLAGVRVRAVILVRIIAEEDQDEDACTDQLMIWAIVRDLIAMCEENKVS